VGVERRTSENEVKVFKFGARRAQIDNEALAKDQIWLQNKYRNALVQIDREFRERYNDIVSMDNPAVHLMREIGARIKELRAIIKVQRTGVKRAGWKLLSPEEKAQIKALSAERKALKPEADRVKGINKTVYGPKIKALNGEFYTAIKAVKAKFADGTYVDTHGNDLAGKKLFWMNEEHVYNNFLKDRDAAMRDKTVLKFHRYEGEGVVTCRPRVQAVEDADRPMAIVLKTKGAKPQKISLPSGKVAEFLASNPGTKVARADALRFKKLSAGEMNGTQKVLRNISAVQAFDANSGAAFFITVQDADGEKTSKRSRRLVKALAHLQIGTGEAKTYFSLPVTLHRPFPEGSTFKSVSAKHERVGKHYRWSLLVTVDFPAPEPAHGKGVVALDPGWAMGTLPAADGRLRVGALTNEAGEFKELALPPEYMSQVEQARRLQSIIDKETNVLIPKVQEWLDKHSDQSELRAHFQSALLAHGNAKRRQREAGGFRHLIKAEWAIRNGAKQDDPALRTALEGWYKSFRHHDEWMRNLADQNDARKLHLYRNWAAQAAKMYHTVVIDDCDLRKAAEAPAAEKDKAQVAGGQRQVAAPSLLVGAFVNAFQSAGGDVRWVIGKTSRTCSQCGHENPALGASREFRCEQCSYVTDRELNSGRNLINAHRNGHSTSVRRSTKVLKPPLLLSRPEVCEKSPAGAETTSLESVA
jgi:hypothetical protein